MKKVVHQIKSIIDVHHLNDLCIIGVEFGNGNKGKVIKLSPDEYAISIPFRNNDYDELIKKPTIQALIKYFDGEADFYYFAQSEEFKDWLLK